MRSGGDDPQVFTERIARGKLNETRLTKCLPRRMISGESYGGIDLHGVLRADVRRGHSGQQCGKGKEG